MADQIRLYISAAADLNSERDVLGLAVSEIPVELGWLIHQSPRKNDFLDLELVSMSDVHLLLVGGDIRAPIGLEWYRARQTGRRPILFRKREIQRTLAAREFIRFTGNHSKWKTYRDNVELRYKVLTLLAEYILDRAAYFTLSPPEVDALTSWRDQLSLDAPKHGDGLIGGAGESGEIFSTERYIPSGGIVLEPGDSPGSDQER